MKRLIAALPLLIAGLAHADTAEWTLDMKHTSIGFEVSHLVVSTVDGVFKQATAKIDLDEADLSKSQVSVDINPASVDTREEKRDEHLRGADFFDVAKFPKITFKSTKIVKAGAGYTLTGDLTIRGVTKRVTLDATVSAPIKTPWGNRMRAVALTGKIKRKDFGLTWNKAMETGGVVVGEDVKLVVKAELTK